MARVKQSKDNSQQKEIRIPEFVKGEIDTLRFWDEKEIFTKTLAQTKNGEPFIFYEGPPTANGLPGIHHILARAFKDVIVRFQTMNGKYVERKAGWDTHGLPVELAIEKELGISGKKEIENIVDGDKRASIAEFNSRCKENVVSLITDWEKITRRIGYWLDFENDYRTYRNDYMETLWWVIKQISEKETSEGPLLYKGYKVVPHCTRCETALSSHEVAQGYKTVQETSVVVKFKITKTNLLKAQSLIEDGKDVSILSWTTTPWTLPGNVALAIDPTLTYVLVKHENGFVIVAKDRMGDIFDEETTEELEFRGEDLLETQYAPLFEGAIDAEGHKNTWTVLPADFVTANEGTGVVHTSVMYGEDDYQLGLDQDLPTHHTVTTSGLFVDSVKGLAGAYVKDPKTEKIILDFLHEQNRIFRVEPYTHEYPFCWRCATPLLYYAKDSWYIRVSALRAELKKNNSDINWKPEHIKNGRFGEWLNEAKDWAISRERYWGTPLPIWECKECGKTEVMGSFDEIRTRAIESTLPEKKKTIFVMRHGEAESNIAKVFRTDIEKDDVVLTMQGKKDVEKAAKALKGKIDLIVTSDFKRTHETATIVSKITGAKLETDSRLREYSVPAFEGKSVQEFGRAYPDNAWRIHHSIEGGETLLAAGKRVEESIIDSVQRFKDKRILFVSHGDSLWAYAWLQSKKSEKDIDDVPYPKKAVQTEVVLKDVPINPHRPYIDDIELQCTCDKKARMKRIEEVIDVWFDSGAMPFAQHHYPFESQNNIDDGVTYPADYITEAIDQTRGWFYTMLVISTILEKGTSYKNVISLGHILDDKGEKMSKSKGNVVDPWEVMEETGSDALRFLFYSMNQPGDVKLFNKESVTEVVRKTFMIMWNVSNFYLLYAPKRVIYNTPTPIHALDKWLLSRLEVVRSEVTNNLSAFNIFDASRNLREFVQDLSTWYVRRSRSRIKEDQHGARDTLGYTIWVTTQLFAPFTPLFAEQLFLRMKNGSKLESIHLSLWPEKIIDTDEKLLEEMETVRQAVELFHSIRKEHSIKSRQPLSVGHINKELSDGVQDILKEEINVDDIKIMKKVSQDGHFKYKELKGLEVSLNSEMTDALRMRGTVREIIRHIMDLRKLARLTPEDTIELFMTCKDPLRNIIDEHSEEISTRAKAGKIIFEIPDDIEVTKNASINKEALVLGLRVIT